MKTSSFYGEATHVGRSDFSGDGTSGADPVHYDEAGSPEMRAMFDHLPADYDPDFDFTYDEEGGCADCRIVATAKSTPDGVEIKKAA